MPAYQILFYKTNNDGSSPVTKWIAEQEKHNGISSD